MVRISYPSPRVSQLDAHILDSELLSLLKQQLTSIFQFHNTSWWTYNQHPEFWTLLLNLLVFRLTTWKSGSSYGLSLQNLKLANFRDGKIITKNKRVLLCAVLIGDYFYQKLESWLYSKDESETYSLKLVSFLVKHRDVLLTKVSEVLKIVNLLNFILFLVNGKFPSVVHRILGISLTPVVTDLLKFTGNNVNFEFQNRQLVWNVMTEFLVFTLPLLKLKAIRRKFNQLVRGGKRQKTEEGNKETPYTNLPISQCAICIQNSLVSGKSSGGGASTGATGNFPITNPYVTNCQHLYCYVCIASRFNSIEISEGDNDKCLRCSEKLTFFKEYSDIDESVIIVKLDDVVEKIEAPTVEESEASEYEYSEEDEEESRDSYDSEGEEMEEDEAFEL